jgi:hypothetical protein
VVAAFVGGLAAQPAGVVVEQRLLPVDGVAAAS